jgi:hypothetical protein
MAKKTKTKKLVVGKSDPISFEQVSIDKIYIYDSSTGEEPKDEEDGLLGCIEINDTYPTYGLNGEFSVENLKDILAVGAAYTEKFKEASDRLADVLPAPDWKK